MITRTLPFQGVPTTRVNQSTITPSTLISPQVQSYQLAKSDAFTRAQSNKQNIVRFGGSVDASAVKIAPQLTNTLISREHNITATGVRIGDNIDNTFLKLLSPSFDLTLFDFGSSRGQLSSEDMQQLKTSIVKPITKQLDRIESLIQSYDVSKLEDAHSALKRALQTSKTAKFIHYVQLAEQYFTSVRNRPPTFELGINAQLGLATCLKMLGEDDNAKEEYLSALKAMTQSSEVLCAVAKKVAHDPKKKAALIKDLKFLQAHCGVAGSKAIYDANQYLSSGTIAKTFVQEKLRTTKDLSHITFWGIDHLKDANLRGVNLSHSDLTQLDLKDKDLSNTDLSYADLSNANLKRANLKNAKILGAKFVSANMQDVQNLQSAFNKLKPGFYYKEHEKYPDFRKADFSSTNLDGLDPTFSFFDGANFQGASLRNSSLGSIKTLDQQAATEYYNEDSDEADGIVKGNFRYADFTGSILLPNIMSSCDFTEAKFKNCYLDGKLFVKSKFDGTVFHGFFLDKDNPRPVFFRKCNIDSAKWPSYMIKRAERDDYLGGSDTFEHKKGSTQVWTLDAFGTGVKKQKKKNSWW